MQKTYLNKINKRKKKQGSNTIKKADVKFLLADKHEPLFCF